VSVDQSDSFVYRSFWEVADSLDDDAFSHPYLNTLIRILRCIIDDLVVASSEISCLLKATEELEPTDSFRLCHISDLIVKRQSDRIESLRALNSMFNDESCLPLLTAGVNREAVLRLVAESV